MGVVFAFRDRIIIFLTFRTYASEGCTSLPARVQSMSCNSSIYSLHPSFSQNGGSGTYAFQNRKNSSSLPFHLPHRKFMVFLPMSQSADYPSFSNIPIPACRSLFIGLFTPCPLQNHLVGRSSRVTFHA